MCNFYSYDSLTIGHELMFQLILFMTAPPILNIESNVPAESPINCMFGHTCTISCKVEANPPPESYWTWRKCNSTSSCEPSINVTETYKKQIEHGAISYKEFNGTHHGNYTCHAKNAITSKEVSISKQIRIVGKSKQNLNICLCNLFAE